MGSKGLAQGLPYKVLIVIIVVGNYDTIVLIGCCFQNDDPGSLLIKCGPCSNIAVFTVVTNQSTRAPDKNRTSLLHERSLSLKAYFLGPGASFLSYVFNKKNLFIFGPFFFYLCFFLHET